MKASLLPIALLVILLLALGGVGAYYASLDADEQTELRQDLGLDASSSDTLEGSGFIEARSVDLTTAEGGIVQRIDVAVGDAVEADDRLLRLRNDSLLTEMLQAQSAVAAARQRNDSVQDAGSSRGQRDLAKAQLQLATAQLKSLGYRIEQQTLSTPVDATILDIFAREGETVAPGAVLLRLGQLDPVRLTIYVPTADVDELEEGQAVEVTVDAYSDDEDDPTTFEGEVVSVAEEAEFTPRNVLTRDERASLVYAVEIRVPNPKGELKPGMPADASIEID